MSSTKCLLFWFGPNVVSRWYDTCGFLWNKRLTVLAAVMIQYCAMYPHKIPLEWLHNERDGVSNHQPNDCLHNLLFFKAQTKEKYQSSASLAFVRGIHRWPVNSPHKGPVTRKMLLFDDVIMPKGYQLKWDDHFISKPKWDTCDVKLACLHWNILWDSYMHPTNLLQDMNFITAFYLQLRTGVWNIR